WTALRWPCREYGYGRLPNLLGRKAQRVHDCADCRTARDGRFPLGCKTKETPRPPLRKLLVQDGERRMDQARRLAHGSGGLEKDIGVDCTTQIQPFRSYASYFSARSCQGLSRSLSPSALYFVAGVENGGHHESRHRSGQNSQKFPKDAFGKSTAGQPGLSCWFVLQPC